MEGQDDTEIAALHALLQDLLALRADIVAEAEQGARQVRRAHASRRDSAGNLLHYLALRRRDLRPLQQRLAGLGLSSLGRSESHVLATLDAVLALLHLAVGARWTPAAPLSFDQGRELLARHADQLLGAPRPDRGVRIMVTMPGAAAHDPDLVRRLLEQGMDCARINCAHDDAATWLAIIGHVRRAAKTLGRDCKVAMDLGGPKIRTGPIDAGPAVLKLRPEKDAYGRVTAPARVRLIAAGAAAQVQPGAEPCLTVPAAWLQRLRKGDQLNFADARERKRTLTIVRQGADGCLAETSATAYLTEETLLRHAGGHARRGSRGARPTGLPPHEGVIRLRKGDALVLAADGRPGRPATVDEHGRLVAAAVVGCTLPQVFADLRAGQSIWLDDGKIGGVIDRIERGEVHVEITQAAPSGSKLRADKGINLPDTALRLPALTGKDLADLAFVAEHADIVELSFANTADDVLALQEQLERLTRNPPAIVLKIETRRGFDNLPGMLLALLRSRRCGVMIARGDLAVECGYERLAEVQEEILWICEAAHVPVIWATQVLESLAQKGRPSRAEVSDAAMSDRAECVMLNKGPYVVDAVGTLDNILRRMQAHQAKKQTMLRMLQLARADLGAVD